MFGKSACWRYRGDPSSFAGREETKGFEDIEAWRGSVESRLEGLEEVTNLIPEILERLGPQTLTADHQRAVQKYVQQMHELTGKPYGTIYDSVKTAFGVPRYVEFPDQDWQRVVQWFRAQLEQWRTK